MRKHDLAKRLIHIVDPDARICEALSVLFRLEGFQTTFSLDAAHFVASLERLRPDVAIINLSVGEQSGLDLLHRVRSLKVGTPVIMLASPSDIGLAVSAMKMGARDVFVRPIDGELLVNSVCNELRKDVHIVPAVAGGDVTVEVKGFKKLTPREREVMQCVVNGRSNKQAGKELGISPRTVEVHRAHVMEKLGARNTADLMRIALTM
ncbi:MAG: hypothetical protein BGO80_03840 [Devosia sp. 63-57]|nr:MAG: hypothetical protein ABS74_04840 [Pelagibacterium sp. SCN 63-126]ODU83032.1 MAG: hypothetical protein ABT14_16225 [Pelagibacterium sp. SCN 63-17]OJX45749.1 MAG: hypothetical protein BGO80_03840 [Devosia sp. 63-57]